MRRLSPRLLLIIASVAAAMPALSAEEGATRLKACIYLFQDLTPGNALADYEQPITEAVAADFRSAGFEITGYKIPHERRTLLYGPTAIATAKEAGADFAVSGSFLESEGQILLSLQCWDVAADVPIPGIFESWRFNLAFYSALHEKLSTLMNERIRLHGKGPKDLKPVLATLTIPEMTFLSPDEGMEVLLAGDISAGVITGGRLTVKIQDVSATRPLLVEKRKEGYHTAWQTVRPGLEIPLSPLVKKSSLAAQAEWSLQSVVGVGGKLRYYLVPDTLFASVGDHFSLIPPAGSGGSFVFHDDVNLGIGWYPIFAVDSPVRVGLSTGAGVILTLMTVAGEPLYTDYYLDVIDWWVETSFLGPTLYIRQEWKYGLGLGDNLLGRGWLMVGGGFPVMTAGVMFKW